MRDKEEKKEEQEDEENEKETELTCSTMGASATVLTGGRA